MEDISLDIADLIWEGNTVGVLDIIRSENGKVFPEIDCYKLLCIAADKGLLDVVQELIGKGTLLCLDQKEVPTTEIVQSLFIFRTKL